MDTFVNFTNITDFDYNEDRILELRKYFIHEYQMRPKYFIKVPGRVNLIGEHVDYCGYPVMPMAISQNILLAVCPADNDILCIKNVEHSKYKNFKCNINSIKIEKPAANTYPQWHNYVLCGIKGVLDYLLKSGGAGKKGFLIAVSGNIPPASGLSSSSALVCAGALTTALLFDMPLNRNLLATISANSEQYIGTIGGGMDQAIAFLAKKGCAQYIEWDPLRATPMQLPEDCVFVIANCLSEANKAATADFNKRVVECRLACKLLAKYSNLDWENISKFAELQKELDVDLEEMEALVKRHLTLDYYTKEDLMSEFGMDEESFEIILLTSNTKHENVFKLKQRALHVFQECIRVENFRDIAANIDDLDDYDAFERLSKLLTESHYSLQNLYECSHPNLDKLVQISEEFGVSARLTGAGWGGCIVAICDSIDTCDKYINELKKSYYAALPEAKGKNLDDIIFATSPQGGAEIIRDEF